MPLKIQHAAPRGVTLATLMLLGLVVAGCTSVLSNDKVDYRSASTVKATPLDVPPDLTQLSRDPRYQTGSGVVSASSFGSAPVATAPGAVVTPAAATPRATPLPPELAASAPNGVAPAELANMRIERDANSRWLVTPLTAEQLWPQLKAFWEQRGFVLTTDDPALGVMETDWAENRAKLPEDIIRRTIGTVFDPLYSTGERDRFRTRVERVAGGGTEIYVTHRGYEEVYTDARQERTGWQPRPQDPQLEAEMLARLMLALAGPAATTQKPDGSTVPTNDASSVAQQAMATPGGPSRARLLTGQAGAAMQVDENFDRAWRRIGLALDRGGFTVEDRDRSSGLYYVRYVDPAEAGKEEPGFFSKLFSFGKAKGPTGPVRYRVALKGAGDATTVAVLTEQGAPEAGPSGQRIVSLLVDALK